MVETRGTIKAEKRGAERKPEKRILECLSKVAPGTDLRLGIEHIIKAKTGGLLVIGNSDEVLAITDGGFLIDCKFSPFKLYELAKMDGAIVLNDDASRILYANTQLIPDPSLPTSETGTRHRAAERTARQTGALVISISQKRDVVSLYFDGVKYVLEDIRVVLAKCNQALQTLERYKNRLDQVSANLTALEFEDLATLFDVTTVLQRSEMVLRISTELQRYICELGTEGRLIEMQLNELMGTVVDDHANLIRDYAVSDSPKKIKEIRDTLEQRRPKELLSLSDIAEILGYPTDANLLEYSVSSRGYRILSKVPRLPISTIENMVKHFKSFQKIFNADVEELVRVEGYGPGRAQSIKDSLRRLNELNMLDKYL